MLVLVCAAGSVINSDKSSYSSVFKHCNKKPFFFFSPWIQILSPYSVAICNCVNTMIFLLVVLDWSLLLANSMWVVLLICQQARLQWTAPRSTAVTTIICYHTCTALVQKESQSHHCSGLHPLFHLQLKLPISFAVCYPRKNMLKCLIMLLEELGVCYKKKAACAALKSHQGQGKQGRKGLISSASCVIENRRKTLTIASTFLVLGRSW